MRPQQSRHRKKHRGGRGQDDDQMLLSRTDEDSYSHSHRTPSNSHYSDNYRTPTSERRGSYDMGREPSSSRTDHEPPETWRMDAVDDRYAAAAPAGGYHDSYHRGIGRDDYDMVETRESEGWGARRSNDSHYPQQQQQRDEWPPRYRDSRDPYGSYQETANWEPTAPNSYDSYDERNSRSRWPEGNSHSRRHEPEHDRNSYRHQDPRGSRQESEVGWEDRGRESDSGWEPRLRENRRKTWEDENQWNRPQSPAVERSWEPADRWKSAHKNESPDHRRPSQRSNGHNKHHKNKKNQHKQNRRDWPVDDSHLNNWQRRDNHAPDRNPKQSSRKKHPRPFSRSRSRSPAESHYSHYSSKGRSRSRSLSPAPKRARREASPLAQPDEPYAESSRARRKQVSGPERRSMTPPPRQSRKLNKSRRRSISSRSSISTDRSRSRSPDERPRAVHRLPTASNPGTIHPRPTGRAENKSKKRHGRNNKNTLTPMPSSEQMPPPSLPPSRPPYEFASSSNAISLSQQPAPERLPSANEVQNESPVRNKRGGFKPIGQNPTPSLKKFFPGDDEDMDVSNDSSSPPRAETQSEDPGFDGEHEKDSNNYTYQLSSFNTHLPSVHDPYGMQQIGHYGLIAERQPYTPTEPPPPSATTELEPMSAPPTREPSEPIPTPARLSVPPVTAQGEVYSIVSQVGEGTFGKVYKARNTLTGAHFALKRIRMETEKEGFPVTAMREIKLLQSLRHDNVVRLHEMMVSSGSVYMVFEYMDHDLTGVLSQTQFSFTEAHLKSLCHQMLAGLGYLHHKGVIHRDIKGSNILINNRGELKLADFGLARFYQKRRKADYTNRVITLWYRPPELLFGATIYGPEVDMWSAGCIMLELFTKKPVFQGNDEISQLDVIYRIIGTPSRDRWADVANLPWYELVKPKDAIPNHFRDLFRKWMSPAALDLAERLLEYDPARRVTATQAMEAPYFTTEDPPASPPIGLATLEGEWHELETKRERARKRREK
ncbi:kinase subunit of RNA polymerase II carboxy-terminal domain kinase I [Marasmius tenuissimus]|nr:kinase subunit of RNA polymerase II carboxy-terminal domain kinase I [Marasmius tenuissimus]